MAAVLQISRAHRHPKSPFNTGWRILGPQLGAWEKLLVRVKNIHLCQQSRQIWISIHLVFFYKKPTTWRVGSTFLWKPRFKAQKFLKLMKISGFCFLTFSHFQPQSFLRYLKFEPQVSWDIKKRLQRCQTFYLIQIASTFDNKKTVFRASLIVVLIQLLKTTKNIFIS